MVRDSGESEDSRTDQERATRVRDETPENCDHEKTIVATDKDDGEGIGEYCFICNDLEQVTLDNEQ